MVRETEICGLELRGLRTEFRPFLRVLRLKSRARLTNRPELRGLPPARNPPRFAGTGWFNTTRSISLSLSLRVRISAVRRTRSNEGTQ